MCSAASALPSIRLGVGGGVVLCGAADVVGALYLVCFGVVVAFCDGGGVLGGGGGVLGGGAGAFLVGGGDLYLVGGAWV